jgi:hypothetical protein
MHCRCPLILTTVVAAAAVLVAGCGGGSSPGVANVSSTTSTSSSSSAGPPSEAQLQQLQRDATRFSHCMRSHGVPNFPDPTVAPRAFKNAFLTQTPAFRSADTACGHLLPPGHSNQAPASSQAQTVALLAFARCLRGHGFPSFPDPTASGQLTHEMLAHAGIDLHDPAVVHAADACTGVTHGVITKAVVAHFVAGH